MLSLICRLKGSLLIYVQLEPFQELPQLLDPHLNRLLPILSSALLEALRLPKKTVNDSPAGAFLIGVLKAVCKLLYTFTKIRGEKVIVRFFGAETAHLELLLGAVEEAENYSTSLGSGRYGGELQEEEGKVDVEWTWEMRYICLLWLSHLLLVPFDLSTISSGGEDAQPKTYNGALMQMEKAYSLYLPPNLPGVAIRVLGLATKYLGAAGKERSAAQALLIRLSMRRDMQALNLLPALITWAQTSLKNPRLAGVAYGYYYIGLLSYLGGILQASLSTSVMDPYLLPMFRTVQNLGCAGEEGGAENPAFGTLHTSALARKTVIKVLRTICALVLRREYMEKGNQLLTTEIVEITVGHLLDSLADADTPVRLAASKALSVITLKLDSFYSIQIVDAVLDSLEANILTSTNSVTGKKERDLSAVNPQEWHGLILTLSHLLYRKSPPLEILPKILNTLLTGLTFEQRSTSGSSVGTNVRDAACFGIWALARRYSTAELKSISLDSSKNDGAGGVIQTLATQLVVASSLDSAGNIRRGASAALQELIGRHPDVVENGIPLVQVVDYHAVALRSRAVLEVGAAAAKLGRGYEDALTEGLLGWRGVGAGDATARRTAAKAIGALKTLPLSIKRGEYPWSEALWTFSRIAVNMRALKPRENDRRHGLLLAMASSAEAVLRHLPWNVRAGVEPRMEYPSCMPLYEHESFRYLQDPDFAPYTVLRLTIERVHMLQATLSEIRKPELLLEAACAAISAALGGVLSMSSVIASCSCTFRSLRKDFAELAEETLEKALALQNPSQELLDEAVSAATLLVEMHRQRPNFRTEDSLTVDPEPVSRIAMSWLHAIETRKSTLARQPGHLFALAHLPIISARSSESRSDIAHVGYKYHDFDSDHPAITPMYSKAEIDFALSLRSKLADLLTGQWHKAKDIESRLTILRSLHEPKSGLLATPEQSVLLPLIRAALDDYTTDSRGDVGSLVRIEALKSVSILFHQLRAKRTSAADSGSEQDVEHDWRGEKHAWWASGGGWELLFGPVVRLAVEKLDKVRAEAQRVLGVVLPLHLRTGMRRVRACDSRAPVSPLTPFFLFAREAREGIRSELEGEMGDGGELSTSAVGMEAVRRWKAMGEEEKMRYNLVWANNLHLHNARVHAYKAGNEDAKQMSDVEAAAHAEEFGIEKIPYGDLVRSNPERPLPETKTFRELETGGREYFSFLLRVWDTLKGSPADWLCTDYTLVDRDGRIAVAIRGFTAKTLYAHLIPGLVTSIDSGSESVLRAARSALVENFNPEILAALLDILRAGEAQERISVAALETLAFLFEAQSIGAEYIYPDSEGNRLVTLKTVFVVVGKAHFRSGSVRKLEAAVRVYASILTVLASSHFSDVGDADEDEDDDAEAEAIRRYRALDTELHCTPNPTQHLPPGPASLRRRIDTQSLTSTQPQAAPQAQAQAQHTSFGPELWSKVLAKLVGMLSHPFPKVREAVVDALWVVGGTLEDEGEGGVVGREEVERVRKALEGLRGTDWGMARRGRVDVLRGALGL